MKILLVQSATLNNWGLQKLLQSPSMARYEFIRVFCAEGAVTELERSGFAAVLLDLGSRPDSTVASIESLRTSHPDVPIIALIDREDETLELELIRRGAQEVLGKDRLTETILAKAIRYSVERLILNRKLRAREQEYRLIVETAQEGVWTIDGNDRTVFVNRKMASMLGYAPSEMAGRPPLDFMDDEVKATALPILSAKGVGRENIDFRFRRKDGSVLWTRVTTSPIIDEGGRFLGAMGFVSDISERRAHEEALLRTEALVHSSMDAIIGKDLDDKIVSWNPAAERLFGYSAAEAIGRSIRFLAPPDRQIELDEILTKIRKGESAKALDTTRRSKDGRLLNVSIVVAPVRRRDGVIIGSSAIIRDISEQKKLEAQFRQAQKMEAVGRLAGGVAHDFNNLITVICGYTSLVLARPLDEETKQELEEVHRAGERAASLTRQLLAFSRKQLLEPQVIDLNPLITDLEKMLRRLIGEDIALTTSLQGALRMVKVDPGQMEQVIMNLAVNARDAMPRGGRLLIETRNVDIEQNMADVPAELEPGPYVQVSVSDTGIGMDKEVQSHLFEPFFTTKGLGKGTGLGLSTIYGIVRQSGGHVTVHSEPGKGTCFRIYLPGTTARPLAAATPGTVKSLSGTETVLLVEDNDVVRRLTSEVLSRNGYRIVAVSSAEEALEQFSRQLPDLLLTDLVLPGIDGLTLCRKAAQQAWGLKRMLMTGYTEEAVPLQRESESGVPLLHKPFSPRILLTAVRGVLGESVSLPTGRGAD